MTKILVVCLGVVICWAQALGTTRAAETFDVANRIGEPNARSFFLFSTSVGNYAIRQDGMGEVSSTKGMRRVFRLKLGAKGRIERVYFLEHEGDLFMLYEVRDGSSEWAFLVRMEQKKRKFRWLTAVEGAGAPMLAGDRVVIDTTEINKTDGKTVGHD